MVAMMRRVKTAYDDQKNAQGEVLRGKVQSLHDESWSLVRSVWVDLTPVEAWRPGMTKERIIEELAAGCTSSCTCASETERARRAAP